MEEDKSSSTDEPSVPSLPCKERDFVVVDDTHRRKYVAHVQKITSTTVTIRCMRSYQTRNDIFIFPLIDDIDQIPMNKIIKILNAPKEIRRK